MKIFTVPVQHRAKVHLEALGLSRRWVKLRLILA